MIDIDGGDARPDKKTSRYPYDRGEYCCAADYPYCGDSTGGATSSCDGGRSLGVS